MRGRFKLKVGLALAGGAARGMAHIGVLRALEREKIQVDIITGTSMGAIIGGAYAATRDIDALERKVREVLTSEEFRKNKLSFLRETKQQRGGLFFSMANLVKRGKLTTPPVNAAILPGITRDSIIRMARDDGLEVEERAITRDELYIADEVFFVGTASEVTPVREIDDRSIGEGKPGPVTLKLQAEYFEVVKGKQTRYPEWLTFV